MKIIIKTVLILMPFYATAQTKIYNPMLKDSTQKILYLGLDNFLKVEGKNIKNDECSMSIDKGKITSIENNQYHVRPETLGITTVSFYKKGKLILSEKFDVQRMPLNYVDKYKNGLIGNDINIKYEPQ